MLVEKTRLTDENIGGVTIHEVLRMEGMTLRAYIEATKGSMWASQVELELAARILSVSVLYMSGKTCVQLGCGTPSHAVRREGSHYVLINLHKKHKTYPRAFAADCVRAGMHQWTWEEEVPTPAASSIAQLAHGRDAYVTVRIDEKIKTDVRRITFELGTMNVADMKARLSAMLKLPVASMVILEEEEEAELPDWTSLPSSIILTTVGGGGKINLEVTVPMRNVNFTLHVTPDTKRTELESMLGYYACCSRQQHAHPKCQRDGVEIMHSVWRTLLLRSISLRELGVRTQISPTVPYHDVQATSMGPEHGVDEEMNCLRRFRSREGEISS